MCVPHSRNTVSGVGDGNVGIFWWLCSRCLHWRYQRAQLASISRHCTRTQFCAWLFREVSCCLRSDPHHHLWSLLHLTFILCLFSSYESSTLGMGDVELIWVKGSSGNCCELYTLGFMSCSPTGGTNDQEVFASRQSEVINRPASCERRK